RAPRAPAPRLFIGKLVRAQAPRVVALEEFGVLQARAGVEDDDLLVLADPTVAAELRRARDRRAALGAQEDALGFAGHLHRLRDLRFAHRDRGPSRLA